MRRGKPRLAQGNIACTRGGRRTVSTQLSQIARKAQLDRKARFTSLAHLLTPGIPHGNVGSDEPAWRKWNRRGKYEAVRKRVGGKGSGHLGSRERHLSCTAGRDGLWLQM